MGRSILITGAAGFIGFHAALALVKQGDSVIGVDDFNDYYDPALKRLRQKKLQEKGVEIIEGDICDTPLIKNLLKKRSISHLLHLAAQAGVRASKKQTEKYVHTNLQGFVSILEAVRESPHISLVFASSASVYGNNKTIPSREKEAIESPNNLYSATKICNEILAKSYHHLYNIPMKALRFFTVYGPFGRPDMACFIFAKNIAKGLPVQLFGEGKMERDFTYIDDIVAGILAAIDSKASYATYNLGNSSPVSISYLVDLLEIYLGKKAIRNHLPYPKGEVVKNYADITKAKQELGYFPKTPLEKGVEAFVLWGKKYHMFA